MIRRRCCAFALVCAAAGVAACGGEPVEVAPAPPTATTPEDKSLSIAKGRAHRLTITVDDAANGRFRYRAPSSVASGLVQIRLRNEGRAPRKAQLWRIAGGHSVAQARRATRPLPDWLRTAGGVALTEPGATGTTLQYLAPGRYYVAGVGGEQGTVAQLRVTGSAAEQSPPAVTARLDARDYSFRTSGLKAGSIAVDFRNTGREPHHVFLAPMRTGASLAEVTRFFNATTSVGVPPVLDSGTRETVVLEGGERQVTELDLSSGRYAMLCFVRDRGGGPPHTKLGMVAELRVP